MICTKVREGDKRIVSVKEGEIKNRHVFIIDDLVKTGIAHTVSVPIKSACSLTLSLPLPSRRHFDRV